MNKKSSRAFPAVAGQTYLHYKNDQALFKITKNLIKKLKKIKNKINRVRYAHIVINKYLEELFKDPIVDKYVACKKGCSFCCHTQVSITEDEALLYVDKIMKEEIKIDLHRLHIQSQAGNDASKWYEIPYEVRKCVFLGNENQCLIYEDRPMVCRSNNVLS
ncbi:MAG: YkgJ family cysteine cluster protein, partial [Halobacteriovoraceae bacterium]|nr:YkgJ family cysteine cluster protein [Halobacteriovoraceae bacterium]